MQGWELSTFYRSKNRLTYIKVWKIKYVIIQYFLFPF